MTTEVAVMNKEAIALAADSAATVRTPQGVKIFNSANKLFELLHGHPVGCMIYNNSEFMELPCETILKVYRQRAQGKTLEFATLEDYANDFIAYLSESAEFLYPQSQQQKIFRDTIGSIFKEIVADIDASVRNLTLSEAREVTLGEIQAFASSTILSLYNDLISLPNMFPDSEANDLTASILAENRQIIEDTIQFVFEKRVVLVDDLEKLKQIAALLYTKAIAFQHYCGFVIAGFGSNDLFPVCITFHLDTVICNRLKYHHIEDKSADVGFSSESSATIIPFAQDDVVANFIEGVHPDFIDGLEAGFANLISEAYQEELTGEVPRLDAEQKEALKKALKTITHKKIKAHWDELRGRLVGRQVSGLMQTIRYLPKHELAATAEALVTLTSFKRRVSMQEETVGGPVDVLVISKKDGLIWIKRKHYFSPELNARFFQERRD